MKQRVSVLLGCVYVAGAAYYGSLSAYAVATGASSPESMTLLLASVWIAFGGLGLAMRHQWGWRTLMAFLLVTSGAHLNRLFAQRPILSDLAPLEPLLWAAAHMAVLAWLGDHTANQDRPLVSQRA